MFHYSLLNLGSLILGLIAWTLPVIDLVRSNKTERRNLPVMSVASLSSCAISLCMQIFYQNHLVKIGDRAALMDTSNAVAVVSAILLVITLILNLITLADYSARR